MLSNHLLVFRLWQRFFHRVIIKGCWYKFFYCRSLLQRILVNWEMNGVSAPKMRRIFLFILRLFFLILEDWISKYGYIQGGLVLVFHKLKDIISFLLIFFPIILICKVFNLELYLLLLLFVNLVNCVDNTKAF